MTGYSYRDFELDAERLYTHLLDLKKLESPDELFERLYRLFVDGIEYPEPEILSCLYRIVTSKWAEQEFKHILNRCCYILINHWWLHLESRQATLELVSLLRMSSRVPARFLVTQRLRELVKQFTLTEQFDVLQQRAQVAEMAQTASEAETERVGSLVYRYPYLYPHFLLEWDSSESGQQAVKQLQAQKERQFEQDLFGYATCFMQRSRPSCPTSIPEVTNPTLLSSQQLEAAIRKFAGREEGCQTYQESARHILVDMSQAQSYERVKWQLYEYLTASFSQSCNPKYGKHHFNHWLQEQLKDTLPQNDSLKPNGFLLVQTCGQLLDTLVANPAHSSNHVIFIDLISNLGATFTVGLLLKIVLLCRSVHSNLEAIKSYLAKRFAILFRHYESCIRSDMEWLVECLDNLMVALTIHFGQAGFSQWTNLIQTSACR